MRSLKRLMKSDREVREICKRETDAYLRENYERIAKQEAYRALAVAFVVLHRCFGFGGKRLHRLKDEIESEFVMMKTGILGRKYDADDCKRFLNERYDIDFEESIYKAEGWDKL